LILSLRGLVNLGRHTQSQRLMRPFRVVFVGSVLI
jgi:hypothetical protein